MPDAPNLNKTLFRSDSVDDSVLSSNNLSYGYILPLGDHSSQLRHAREWFDRTQNPFTNAERSGRVVLSNVADNPPKVVPCQGRPN